MPGSLHILVTSFFVFCLSGMTKIIFYDCLLTLISLIAVEVGINVEGGIFWKKLVDNCNKRGVEGGKNLRNQ